MKHKTKTTETVAPTVDDFREYAYHLYELSGRVPGRDVDNWLEAKACLEANVPRHRSHARLHHHRHPPAEDAVAILAVATETSLMTPFAVEPAPGFTLLLRDT
jgi:hypothetical protein